MTITFDGVELVNAGEYDFELKTLTKETTLLSGKRSVQTSTETGLFVTIPGAGTGAEVDAISAKIGAKGSLVLIEGTYTNCVISGNFKKKRAGGRYSGVDWYFYEVSFVRETI
jgi:hypothetical protein